ncbi:NAD(P)-binding protein [Scytonema sp. PRP1]|uniref:NAD(P)-binding protein n=1 Tax=Scytonema sp. PRP1 TaxID=3120513 RepID=UPI002FCED9A6
MSSINQPWTTVESILKEINNVDNGKERQKIGILGAGMAGLAAAYELKKQCWRDFSVWTQN